MQTKAEDSAVILDELEQLVESEGALLRSPERNGEAFASSLESLAQRKQRALERLSAVSPTLRRDEAMTERLRALRRMNEINSRLLCAFQAALSARLSAIGIGKPDSALYGRSGASTLRLVR